ncbi:S1C family serine protease [Paenibacillus sp.]|uniref:S1C family serine protease n=1 Tax=Paenibacillus sp. TaxID=58172 RepID=UPI002D361318|nr:trypsin-like peptidase domain-containing protein [Paenibacillus sp.]HZG86062.1 trypsin-like peptidase domain-containing protein [Paenibacillus sp.]
MKLAATIVISLAILLAGGTASFVLNGYWSKPAASGVSELGKPPALEDAGGSDGEEDEGAPDLKEMIRTHQQRVVSIEASYAFGSGQGSGFLYNDLGDVVTNAHVVAGAESVMVKLSDTSLLPGQVIGIDEEKDVALIRVDGLAGEEPLQLELDKEAEVGDAVVAFGSPLGFDNTVTTGIISGLDRDLDIDNIKYRDVYQISAPITNGNSGGPLVLEASGKVIGINSAGNDQGNIGFSIPIHQVIDMLEAWSDNPDEALAAATNGANSGGTAFTEELVAEDAQYLLTFFYESINSGDYVTAYSLLGSEWQTGTTYESFREGYLYTTGAYVTDMTVVSASEESAVLDVVIEAWELEDGEPLLSYYELQYTVKPENGTLKIVSGKGQRLE